MMSRLKRLKEEKRKKRIKATSCGLALALMMGSAQGLGTYALFTDTEDITSELAISTGDVDVEIDKKSFSYDDVQSNAEFKREFKISNHGTLNQNINLGLISPTEGISKDIYDCISSYKVEFSIDEEDNPGIVPIDNLKLGICELKVNDGSGQLFILSPGKSITCNVTIKMKDMTEDQQIDLSGQKLNIDLNIEAIQIYEKNIGDKGFYDIEKQSNILTIGEYIKNILTGMIKVTGHTVTIEFKDVPELTDNLKSINVVEDTGTNEFLGASTGTTNNNKLTINFPKSFNLDGVDEEFKMEHTVQIKFEYNDGTEKVYLFDFRKAKYPTNHSHLDAKYELVDQRIISEDEFQDVVEPPKEEVEEPREPEVVESPKEEVEIPSEPEVVEPPKEETIEIPKQLEIIEPPKESEGIQE